MNRDIPERLRKRYMRTKQESAASAAPGFALEILASDRIGLMADIMNLISSQSLSPNHIQSWNDFDDQVHITIQVPTENPPDSLLTALQKIPSIERVLVRPTNLRVYGKRVIVLGGGAQVAAVASGAIAEADRHNIRGELISVDTIAVVGEAEIAQAVRAVGRLHRAGILVLAGALMGGQIRDAVIELRQVYGIPVMALRMAGSVMDAADLVVTDPTEAGVMSVMLLSSIGKFDLLRVHGMQF